MNILGISCFYHDAAACLVSDGEIIAAAQEERFTRKKHDQTFPIQAIQYCLKQGEICSDQLDFVAFYDKPWIKFERILETYLAFAPKGIRSFYKAIPIWLKQKLWIPELIKKELNYDGKILFTEHHESHAAAAFFPSPFHEAAFLTMDGVGEWTTTSFGVGKGQNIQLQYEINFPHSLGLLYSAFTYFAGFKVNSGEYKLMGLAPYGEPKYAQLILDELINLKEDGSFRLNMKYFDYCSGLRMINKKFEKLFGTPSRKPESKITQTEMDIARSIQEVTEEVMLRITRHVHDVTGQKRLCLAGGVALNCVGNGRILRDGIFEDIWIQPAAGDAGGALGAALFTWYQILDNPREVSYSKDLQKASYLGPEFSDNEIEQYLKDQNASFVKHNQEQIAVSVAKLIAEQNVVGWFQGRMEFGPRALGARSILGDARSPEMQSIMNLKIKFRESFRPFAPTVLQEKCSEYFDLDRESPYMLLVAQVAEFHKKTGMLTAKGLENLKVNRSNIPAVTHVDHSARIQTVSFEDNPLYHSMINQFYKLTGCPVIINTSFNVRGEPIVCTPKDAYRCFMRTNMDFLVLGNFLLEKKKQPKWEEKTDWQNEYELD